MSKTESSRGGSPNPQKVGVEAMVDERLGQEKPSFVGEQREANATEVKPIDLLPPIITIINGLILKMDEDTKARIENPEARTSIDLDKKTQEAADIILRALWPNIELPDDARILNRTRKAVVLAVGSWNPDRLFDRAELARNIAMLVSGDKTSVVLASKQMQRNYELGDARAFMERAVSTVVDPDVDEATRKSVQGTLRDYIKTVPDKALGEPKLSMCWAAAYAGVYCSRVPRTLDMSSVNMVREWFNNMQETLKKRKAMEVSHTKTTQPPETGK